MFTVKFPVIVVYVATSLASKMNVETIVVFCIVSCLYHFMLALLCFCVAAEFSVNKDLYTYKKRILLEQRSYSQPVVKVVMCSRGSCASEVETHRSISKLIFFR